jgi:hypothetical protein
MTRRTWVRLDNASNIFLAARTESDTKVFRLSAEMDAEVDPELLQEALDAVFERYPLYHAVLRRGVFWYYLQDSDLRPVVEPERRPTCAPIYQAGRRTLLFRVIHHRRRISLEVFHALSDGTGAMWFLSDLLEEYARRRYQEQPPTPSQPAHALEPDSFAHYFRRRRPSAFEEAFTRAAAPAALTLAEKSVQGEGSADAAPASSAAAASAVTGPSAMTGPSAVTGPSAAAGSTGTTPAAGGRRRIHRVRGTRTPDSRTRAVELTMPASQLLALSKAAGASPTMYLTALFMDAVRESSGGLGRARTMSASVPVNLRQFFPSTSARNFFATIRVEHTFGSGPYVRPGTTESTGKTSTTRTTDPTGATDATDATDDPAAGAPDSPEAIARALEAEFRPQASAAALAPKAARFIRVERSPLLRVVPRPLKDLFLGWLNAGANRHLSLAVSNLGRLRLPEPAASHVGSGALPGLGRPPAVLRDLPR